MKSFCKNILSYISPCFNTWSGATYNTQTGSSQIEVNISHFEETSNSLESFGAIKTTSLNNIPLSINHLNLTPSSPTNSLRSVRSIISLENSPEVYKNMLEEFIKRHGADSWRVKDLILEENTIADRIHNIKVITGNFRIVEPINNIWNRNPNTYLKSCAPKGEKGDFDKFDISSIIADIGHHETMGENPISLETISNIIQPAGEIINNIF